MKERSPFFNPLFKILFPLEGIPLKIEYFLDTILDYTRYILHCLTHLYQ